MPVSDDARALSHTDTDVGLPATFGQIGMAEITVATQTTYDRGRCMSTGGTLSERTEGL